MKLRLARPEWLIDINDVAELRHITEDADVLRDRRAHPARGAARLRRRRPAVPDRPRRREGDRRPGRPQPRHDRRLARPGRPGRGPHHRLRRPRRRRSSSPARRGAGRRHRPSSTAGPYETACEQHELITEIRLPIRAAHGQRLREGRAAGRRLGGRRRRRGASALAEDGTIADAAIGLTALGLEGLATDAAAVLHRRAAQRGPLRRGRPAGRARPAHPIEDQRGPVDYKRHLADELTRRVLRRALDRVGATATAAEEADRCRSP